MRTNIQRIYPKCQRHNKNCKCTKRFFLFLLILSGVATLSNFSETTLKSYLSYDSENFFEVLVFQNRGRDGDVRWERGAKKTLITKTTYRIYLSRKMACVL